MIQDSLHFLHYLWLIFNKVLAQDLQFCIPAYLLSSTSILILDLRYSLRMLIDRGAILHGSLYQAEFTHTLFHV